VKESLWRFCFCRCSRSWPVERCLFGWIRRRSHTLSNAIVHQVLRKIEQMRLLRVKPDEMRMKLDQLLKNEELQQTVRSPIDESASDGDKYDIDELSHYILRLSYCQSEDLRKWFLQQESELFRHRLTSLSDDKLAESVKEYCRLKPISKSEKEALSENLSVPLSSNMDYFAVPFEQALDLVAKRDCFLYRGEAILPQNKLVAILVHKFRANLSRCLAVMGANGSMSNATDPEAVRIQPLLKNMDRILVYNEPAVGESALGQTITAANVLNYRDNMPLCMRQLQSGLQQDKKLKHWGRLQYGLFLKGAGLSMEDALAFFQRHFSAVTGEQFQKQYSYGIRHMYGREGKRTQYTPYNCSKIIMGNAPSGSGDRHGCPYKHYDAEHLSQLLLQLKVGTSVDRQAIVRLKKENQFQLACQKHFEVTHPGASSMDIPLDNVGNHPNSWFRASVSYSEAKSGGMDVDGDKAIVGSF
jgi:DNA primase large subunit